MSGRSGSPSDFLESSDMRQPRLLPEQEELLGVLVESFRSVPRDQRNAALILESMDGTSIAHAGLSTIGKSAYRPYLGDAKELAERGLIRLEKISDGAFNVDVTVNGFHYYENMKATNGQPVERVEGKLRTYLIAEDFERRHPASVAKWKQAEVLLWSSDSAPQLTTIGHLCREAMQDFATESLGPVPNDGTDQNIQHTVNRVRDAINARLASDSVREFAEALLIYWKALNGLVQRQEHRAAELSWEDARRVVFQTLVVMYEIDRAMGPT